MVDGLPSLRDDAVHAIWRAVILRDRRAFQVTDYSLQTDHVHLIIEARDSAAISSALCGIGSSFARRLNRHWGGRRGPVIDHRYHRRDLASPTELAHAVRYVLGNWAKHGHAEGGAGAVDPFSSAGCPPESGTRAWTWMARRREFMRLPTSIERGIASG